MDLADSQLLQRVSAEIIREGDEQSLYDTIIDAAIAIMQSRHASMQIFDPERRELKLLNVEDSTTGQGVLESVSSDSSSICGRALRTGKRVMVPDVRTCEFLDGTDDQKAFPALASAPSSRRHSFRELASCWA